MDTSLTGLNDGFNAKESNGIVGRGIECSDKDSIEKGTTEKGAANKFSADDAAKKGAAATKEEAAVDSDANSLVAEMEATDNAAVSMPKQ